MVPITQYRSLTGTWREYYGTDMITLAVVVDHASDTWTSGFTCCLG
ncbi:hypothetical protein [Neorhodopirellula lusitana]|nr:hypothetical protein [Neorhodopirellula lusitana]